jgi:nucleotide-binding universal stress UspA family protein
MATSQTSISVSFKTILFATDFSACSGAAVPYVSGLAHCFDSRIIAVHAVPFEPLSGLTAVPPALEFDMEWRASLQDMRTYEASDPFAGLRHEFLLEKGFLRDVVTNLVAQKHVDLVVVGTHGRQGFHKVFGGSFAEELLRTVACPILTVGPGAHHTTPADSWKPRRIVFATEFDGGSLHALPLAIALADANDGSLLVMHALPLVPWEQQNDLNGPYEQRLRNLISEDLPHHCSVDFTVQFDLAAPAILSVAEETEADLIVMGVHHARLPKIDAHVPGTTAAEVIANARCPVLTVCG